MCQKAPPLKAQAGLVSQFLQPASARVARATWTTITTQATSNAAAKSASNKAAVPLQAIAAQVHVSLVPRQKAATALGVRIRLLWGHSAGCLSQLHVTRSA